MTKREAFLDTMHELRLTDDWQLADLFTNGATPSAAQIASRIRNGAKRLRAGTTPEYVAQQILAGQRRAA